jgi:nucleoside permease NupC
MFFLHQWILGKLFYPFAFILGIDVEELEIVGRLIGMKTVVNEFVAYQQLAELGDKLSVKLTL